MCGLPKVCCIQQKWEHKQKWYDWNENQLEHRVMTIRKFYDLYKIFQKSLHGNLDGLKWQWKTKSRDFIQLKGLWNAQLLTGLYTKLACSTRSQCCRLKRWWNLRPRPPLKIQGHVRTSSGGIQTKQNSADEAHRTQHDWYGRLKALWSVHVRVWLRTIVLGHRETTFAAALSLL